MADWTPIGETVQGYTDTVVFEMDAETKKLEKIVGQALVAGEENSQYIKFVLPRYWDGIDISAKTFSIEYALSGTYYGTSEAVNAEMSTDQVRFGWIVPETACAISGTLLFVLKVESTDYVLKSQIADVPVFKTLDVGDVVPEPTKEAWYREFEARSEEVINDAEATLEQANAAVTNAENAAQNAQASENNAEAAAAEAQIRYGSPLTASEAALMVEENRVYVYTGSESGYTFGNWYYYDGSAWVSGGVYNGSAVNTDTTLTQSGMAADAKETGDQITELKSGLNELDGQINGTPVLTPTQIPLSDFTVDNWKLWKSDGKWGAQTNAGYYIALPSDTVKVTINGNADWELLYAFLSSYQPVSGQVAPIIGGTAIPTPVSAGGTSEVDVPQGSAYLWIQRINADGKHTDPSSVVFYKNVSQESTIIDRISDLEDGKVDKVEGKGLSTNDFTEADKANLDDLDVQVNGGTVLAPTDKTLSDFTLANWFISPSTGKWQSGTNRGYFVEVGDCKKISLIGNDTYSTEVAFLTEYSPVADALAPIVGGTLPTQLALGQSYEAEVPQGATYFYVRRLDANGHNIEPSNIKFYYSQTDEGIAEKLNAVRDDVDEINTNIDSVKNVAEKLPYLYTLENKAITASGVITASNSSLLSGIFHVAKDTTIVSDGTYRFRVLVYSDASGQSVRGVSDWTTGTYTFSSDSYVRFHARYALNENLKITSAGITPHISDTCGMPKTLIKTASVDELSDYKKINLMSMNEVLPDAQDMLWTWWNYPQVQSFSRSRDKLYWVYTTSDGYAGVAAYDYRTKTVIKNHLKKAGTDDHNAPAIYLRSDGHVIASYAGGHEIDNFIHIRHSSARENIEHFDEEIRLESYAFTTYSQIHEYNGTLYIFYRRNSQDWMVVKSTDGGYTWSSEEIVVHANSQYYVLFKPTTVDGVLRMVMYSNPVVGAPEIRQGFLHLDTWGIYNSDNSTYLGTDNIDYTNFTVLIGLEDASVKPYQRFLDTAVSAPNVTRILYCQFSDDATGDAIYKLYDSGNTVTICPAGLPFWVPKYQCGAAFINKDKIVVIYNDNGKDYVTIWEYSNGTVQKTKTIYEETVGDTPIRNARPIVDINGKALLWHRGFYNPDRFTDFDTDAKIYDIVNDEILI